MIPSAQVESSQADPGSSVYLLINMHSLIAARRHDHIRSRRVISRVRWIPGVDLVIAGRRDIGFIPGRVTDSLRRRKPVVRAAPLVAETGSVPPGACRETSARF